MIKKRYVVPELMDDPNLDPQKHRHALAGLRRINKITRSGKSIAQAILKSAAKRNLQHVSVLDLGCGSGDVAIRVYRELSGTIPCHVTGWDISATAIETARCSDNEDICFKVADAFAASQQSLRQFDFVYCSLFLHHFSHEQAITLLKTMKSLAKIGLVVDDLLRSTLGLCLAHLGCRVLTRSSVVHYDGPQSVRAAFTIEEVSRLAGEAGLVPINLSKHWPERFVFTWEAP